MAYLNRGDAHVRLSFMTNPLPTTVRTGQSDGRGTAEETAGGPVCPPEESRSPDPPKPAAPHAIPCSPPPAALHPEPETIPATLSPAWSYPTRTPEGIEHPPASWPPSSAPAGPPGHKTTHLSRR